MHRCTALKPQPSRGSKVRTSSFDDHVMHAKGHWIEPVLQWKGCTSPPRRHGEVYVRAVVSFRSSQDRYSYPALMAPKRKSSGGSAPAAGQKTLASFFGGAAKPKPGKENACDGPTSPARPSKRPPATPPTRQSPRCPVPLYMLCSKQMRVCKLQGPFKRVATCYKKALRVHWGAG